MSDVCSEIAPRERTGIMCVWCHVYWTAAAVGSIPQANGVSGFVSCAVAVSSRRR